MLDAVIRETKAAGLFINVAKNQVRGDLIDILGAIMVDSAPIERVEDFNHIWAPMSDR
jgi:hypothetical protein